MKSNLREEDALLEFERKTLETLSENDENYKMSVLKLQELRKKLEDYCPENEAGQFIKLANDIGKMERIECIKRGIHYGYLLIIHLNENDRKVLYKSLGLDETDVEALHTSLGLQ